MKSLHFGDGCNKTRDIRNCTIQLRAEGADMVVVAAYGFRTGWTHRGRLFTRERVRALFEGDWEDTSGRFYLQRKRWQRTAFSWSLGKRKPLERLHVICGITSRGYLRRALSDPKGCRHQVGHFHISRRQLELQRSESLHEIAVWRYEWIIF